MARKYIYGMDNRPFGIGCQPKNGFVSVCDSADHRYWNILTYSRKLTIDELHQYELTYLGIKKVLD